VAWEKYSSRSIYQKILLLVQEFKKFSKNSHAVQELLRKNQPTTLSYGKRSKNIVTKIAFLNIDEKCSRTSWLRPNIFKFFLTLAIDGITFIYQADFYSHDATNILLKII